MVKRSPPVELRPATRRAVTAAALAVPLLAAATPLLPEPARGALMALFTIVLLAQVIFSKGPIGYDKWAGIFSSQWMKVLTFAVIASLLYHVWVGMRDVWMDYVQPVGIRLFLQIFTIVWLVGCAGWAIQVLWRI